jgi:hypothetical protein
VNVTATEENTYRGGVVLENGSVPVPDLNATLVYTCVSECLKGSPPTVEYNDWVKWNKPSCWCFRRQCRGDADGKTSLGNPVATADLNLLKAALNKADTVLKNITGGICADFDHKSSLGNRVATADLNILKAFLNKATTSVSCCDTAAPDPCNCVLQAGDKWNFWTN